MSVFFFFITFYHVTALFAPTYAYFVCIGTATKKKSINVQIAVCLKSVGTTRFV